VPVLVEFELKQVRLLWTIEMRCTPLSSERIIRKFNNG